MSECGSAGNPHIFRYSELYGKNVCMQCHKMQEDGD